jgi:hypothetical protein
MNENATEALRVASCFDDFDGDLYRLVPEAKDLRSLQQYGPVPLYTYGFTGRENRVLSHPAVWNTCGAMFWTIPPQHERNEHGWVSISGHVTDDRLLEITTEIAVRDAWVHGYAAIVDDYEWFRQAPVMMELLALARGWMEGQDHVPREQLWRTAVRWVDDACLAIGRRIKEQVGVPIERPITNAT